MCMVEQKRNEKKNAGIKNNVSFSGKEFVRNSA